MVLPWFASFSNFLEVEKADRAGRGPGRSGVAAALGSARFLQRWSARISEVIVEGRIEVAAPTAGSAVFVTDD